MVKEAIKYMTSNIGNVPQTQIWRKILRPNLIPKIAFFL